MNTPVFVKVCGLTRASDVAAAVSAGADAIGFVFARSPRQVSPDDALAISADVPGGVLRVAVMLHPTQAEWDAVADGFGPDVLQTDAEDFATLRVAQDVTRWPVFRQRSGGDIETNSGDGTYVYEGAKSGRGETVDWAVAARQARSGRMILAGGLGPDNVAEAVRRVRPFGVDASSSLEAGPGLKSADKMAAFVDAAKRAAATDSQRE